MALFIIAFLFLIFGFFCRAHLARRLLWGSAILVLIAMSSFFWVDGHFAAAGCDGNILSGLSCPDPSFLTRVAIAHAAMGIYALAAGVFAAPAITIIALWLETRHRRKARDA